MKKLALFVLAALALGAGFYAQQLLGGGQTVGESAAPKLAFAYPDVNGQVQDVAQWQGKVLVINFWASWCGPCLKEIPEFIKLQDEYAGKNVQFVGIAIEDKEPVAEYLQRVKINYPILIAGDAGSGLSRQLGNIINAVPFSVIVNQQGQIVHRQPGELSRDQFIKVVEPLLAAK